MFSSQSQKMSPVSTTNDDFKMVLVIRKDLKMGKGKAAAQCAHAAVASYKMALKYPSILNAWEDCGQMKITVQVLKSFYNNKKKQTI